MGPGGGGMAWWGIGTPWGGGWPVAGNAHTAQKGVCKKIWGGCREKLSAGGEKMIWGRENSKICGEKQYNGVISNQSLQPKNCSKIKSYVGKLSKLLH